MCVCIRVFCRTSRKDTVKTFTEGDIGFIDLETELIELDVELIDLDIEKYRIDL